MRVVNWFVSLVVVLTSVVALNVATAPAANAVHCTNEFASDTVTFGGTSHARGVVYYDVCKNNGARWVWPKTVKGQYWGYHGNCSAADPFDGFNFNFYMWDNLGRNVNPPWFHVPCEPDGNNTRVWGIDNPERLYFKNGAPKWKANVTELWRFGLPDFHKTVSGTMHRR